MARTAARKSAKRSTRKSHALRMTSARWGGRRWSKRVTETSDAMDLKGGVFKLRAPKKIAASLKCSAERSDRRKTHPYRAALSMLMFKNLSASRENVLNRAKDELKHQFHKD